MALLLLLLLSVVWHVTGTRYVIPEVQVEVYSPRGVRIWIPHREGTRLFAFHGNVNRPMRNYEIGDYYKDVLEPVNGMWIYEDKLLRLRRGDKLHYWVYVLYNKLGYRRDDLVYTVKDVIGGEMPKIVENNTKPEPEVEQVGCGVKPEATTKPSADEDLRSCERNVLNLLPKLVKLEQELDRAKENFALLSEIANAKASSKMLRMSGRLSEEQDALAVVKFILNEKLGLKPEVTFAERNLDGSIDFQVGNVEELLAVVRETRAKLTNSKVVQIRF